MDIKYMEYVLALAKAGNITQAAKDLYISQPTLSQFIRNYQNTLGIHLLPLLLPVRHSANMQNKSLNWKKTWSRPCKPIKILLF